MVAVGWFGSENDTVPALCGAEHENVTKAEVERRLRAKVHEQQNEWMVQLRAKHVTMDTIPSQKIGARKKEVERELRSEVERDVVRPIR